MNPSSLKTVFLIFLVLSVILLPTLGGAYVMDLAEDDDLADGDFLIMHDFAAAWNLVFRSQMSVLLRLELSIFILFVVYLGGRSKVRRFNDRTIDGVNFFTFVVDSLKTALTRTVFNFRFLSMLFVIIQTRFLIL